MRKLLLGSLFAIMLSLSWAQPRQWTATEANEWYARTGWLCGANFLPSTAINQLEMWQADTWDPATIDRELGWAASIGMNVMRVYLHDLAWAADPEGFLQRMDAFLGIAERHRIRILFTIFDDCWNPDAATGTQPAPRPGVHNSGWVRSPNMAMHNDTLSYIKLEPYVKAVLGRFKNDNRVLMWDLYNEPGNSGYGMSSFTLLQKAFAWAWEVRPSQPLTAGVWFNEQPALNAFQLANSDVITYHNYSDTVSMKQAIDTLQRRGRPVICTEYMARTNNSLFATHLPLLKRYGVGAINWGLVSGKSNTIFPWGSKEGTPEPKLWFHDIFRKDGTPFSEAEVQVIKQVNGML